MTDRELLELAAKAAGIEVIRSRLDDPMNADFLVRGGSRNPYHEFGAWNPLADDGDALRLAGALQIDLTFGKEIHPLHAHRQVTAWVGDSDRFDEFVRDATQSATRRAIVRAAAYLAKESK